MRSHSTAEYIRLVEAERRTQHWRRWGPYLPERQWGTVREDYSDDGSCWDYFSYDVSRSRVYRWGEDGLLGWCDRKCRLCFSVALWNGRDSHLKEKLFGLTGPQGNHGEDVKEVYYYLNALPSYSYAQAAYCYPHKAFPYQDLIDENSKRTKSQLEYEVTDVLGLFDDGYFDLLITYAKGTPNDTLIELRVRNISDKKESLTLLPTLWFRNTWSWGRTGEAFNSEPRIEKQNDHSALATHDTLGSYVFSVDPGRCGGKMLWTNNETNFEKLYNQASRTSYTKDAFHRYVVDGEKDAIAPHDYGTKMAFSLQMELAPGAEQIIPLRLTHKSEEHETPFADGFQRTLDLRKQECFEFYDQSVHPDVTNDEVRNIATQAYGGLLWTKQFYYYSVDEWLQGDPTQPPPAEEREKGRNAEWNHLYNMDVISMPDKWEYPWYAAWDLAFHTVALARVDPQFAKDQLLLFLREWYMHPNGQIPAYEFAFSDVNPPVHAWAVWRVYKMTSPKGYRDRAFLERAFHKLLINFTWWVNRKDVQGNNLFTGGFLGLDNIGIFDRSAPAPFDGYLEQSDATAWMAFYCGTMLSIALELAREEPSYSDIASKFFEHFISIAKAMNSFDGTGLWDDQDGFYYDLLNLKGDSHLLRIRSLVGLLPLLAVEVLDDDVVDSLPGFKKRMAWFIRHKSELAKYITYFEHVGPESSGMRMLALPSRGRLERILSYLLSEEEFLSPYGIRSLSKFHESNPYALKVGEDKELSISYNPGESTSSMFGGNSNWRGPVWFPMNFLIIEALERYFYFYRDGLKVEFPTGSGNLLNLGEVSVELSRRLIRLFEPNDGGLRPYLGEAPAPFFTGASQRDRLLFHEYFHGDSGRGLGASHQTGWTALVAILVDKIVAAQSARREEVGLQLRLSSDLI